MYKYTSVVMGYSDKTFILKDLIIPPEFLFGDLDEKIKVKTENLLLYKQTKHGLIVSVGESFPIGLGEIKFDNTGFTRYSINVKVKIYKPIDGEILKTKIKELTSNGFFVDEPITTFVVSKSSLKNKKIGDDVRVKITKVSFNSEFTVLGIEVPDV